MRTLQLSLTLVMAIGLTACNDGQAPSDVVAAIAPVAAIHSVTPTPSPSSVSFVFTVSVFIAHARSDSDSDSDSSSCCLLIWRA